MKEILGRAKTIRELLGGAKFAVDYYQREYRWQTKHVTELIDDLVEKFRESHDPNHERSEVENYGHYFLGSIIISDKEGHKFLIDGQQRLTTITLLLIYIYRHLQDEEQKSQLAELIFSMKYGKRSFNLDVPERTKCMEALFTGEAFEEEDQIESVVNIFNRYQDIQENFPAELLKDSLPFFADWLIENVHLVEITAYSDADAYKIFETMNDRGLSLTPTDMLKGYLLSNITDTDSRNESSRIWRKHIDELQKLGKEEDADSIKAWLRSQYAKTIRERKRDAQPGDFDLIATEFHRWVRDHEKDLGLTKSADFARFIQEDFAFYAHWYKTIRNAVETLTSGLETIYYNGLNNFTLQYPVLLAPLCLKDNDKEIYRKLRVVSKYLDILITRRVWNWHAIDYSTMQYSMFLTMRDIRGKSAPELAEILTKRLAEETKTFADNENFYLHGTNRKKIHLILARLTDYVETNSGRGSHFLEYIQRRGKNGYEVEHIWADFYDRHKDEFSHPSEFDNYRNRIGGLLLLPKSFNASYGDIPYEQKREHYLKQNLLAMSLHEKAYKHDPGFKKFLEKTGLPFQPHSQFKKADLDQRQELYRKIAEQIWNPDLLFKEAEA